VGAGGCEGAGPVGTPLSPVSQANNRHHAQELRGLLPPRATQELRGLLALPRSANEQHQCAAAAAPARLLAPSQCYAHPRAATPQAPPPALPLAHAPRPAHTPTPTPAPTPVLPRRAGDAGAARQAAQHRRAVARGGGQVEVQQLPEGTPWLTSGRNGAAANCRCWCLPLAEGGLVVNAATGVGWAAAALPTCLLRTMVWHVLLQQLPVQVVSSGSSVCVGHGLGSSSCSAHSHPHLCAGGHPAHHGHAHASSGHW